MDGKTYTVSELAAAVGRAVARAFPDEIWVEGEIRDLSRAASGHVYFTLIDGSRPAGSPDVLPVTLFASDRAAVNRVLARSGAVRMTDGVAVRVRGRLSHYGGRGTVQLRMSWIDTEFTLGKMAADRARLVKRLTEQGLIGRNPGLPVPLVPLRVGLVTSVGSAAHADFMHELSQSGLAWRVAVFDARVQGAGAADTVTRGLEALERSGVEVIALVRGGGAKTDLAAFDSEEVAVAIATCGIPVLTGIGHETDVSVADLVARSFKTPTACASGLVAFVTRFAVRIDTIATATRRSVGNRLSLEASSLGHRARRLARSAAAAEVRARQAIADTRRQINRGARRGLARDRVILNNLHVRISQNSHRQAVAAESEMRRMAADAAAAFRRSIGTAEGHLEGVEQRLGLSDPAKLLARGWSVTRTVGGALVLDPAEVPAGARLRTTVAGGTIMSVVSGDNEEVVHG